jgi:hypothetical protein
MGHAEDKKHKMIMSIYIQSKDYLTIRSTNYIVQIFKISCPASSKFMFYGYKDQSDIDVYFCLF